MQTEVTWYQQYPLADSLVGVRMLRLAGAGGHPWGFWQILVGQGSGQFVVGDIGFHGPPDPDGVVEIGYEVVPDWRRHGLASWAVRQLLATAADHGAQSVQAEVIGENPASAGVLERCGFIVRDQHDGRTVWIRRLP
ncbi:MAG TPA: GNAT family N-acetyltransferase [Candidatus Avipropionibacterium avicola]|uniref:GNAT family N-acetyltransferase n=1 Tax=Candidatus Avipropionibacterium avicola TaxID=2840701 RepID=A0A9D1KLS1_9ACTN|nr:GNAT family N-acetyltransferase [Candidatus Avipropionibacterium avicola]